MIWGAPKLIRRKKKKMEGKFDFQGDMLKTLKFQVIESAKQQLKMN